MTDIKKEKQVNKTEKKKGFFGRLMDKLDKNLEEQAKNAGCCDGTKKGNDKSCC